jgi:hydrogenase expression/formation protein HypE
MDLNCPIPNDDSEGRVKLSHGGGGRAMHDLLKRHILPFCHAHPGSDAALLALPPGRAALTTDSYVVDPLFFPGGDIGALAVNGTVNDLAMVGAAPHSLSLGLVIEEGLPIQTLRDVMASVAAAAEAAGIAIVTGDTKVVERGKGDGLFINTSGVGVVSTALDIGARHISAGDAILVSGDLGRHGIAIVATRQELQLHTPLQSDCAPLWPAVSALLDAGVNVHCMRDLTRGGLASCLNELAEEAQAGMVLQESAIDVIDEVSAICELLGFDPLHVANEGRFVAIVPASEAEQALAALRRVPVAAGAALIGHVGAEHAGSVALINELGAVRQLPMLSGEQLPRIC